uniref:site-specific DNA-methyltransferase (adenine-specific) n=1 Tax=Mantoniella tinhauana virus 1 TaxID=3111543 RepID=A0AB38ZM41_9VIRU
MDLFPENIDTYHEPFVGGGSVLFTCLSTKSVNKVFASDINPFLIGMYKNVKENPDGFVTEMRTLIKNFNECTGTVVNRKPKTIKEAKTSRESYYYWVRAQFNAVPSEEQMSLKTSSMFLFLNKTCFRGLYREGPNGFNVPYGNYKNPAIMDESHIHEVSELIKNVTFTVEDFTHSLARVKPGDFVYLDPPYAPINDTSFVNYNSSGFDLNKHRALFKMCRELKCKMLMSNANVELVRNAFPDSHYNTKTISCKRAINSKEPNSRVEELLVTQSDQ